MLVVEVLEIMKTGALGDESQISVITLFLNFRTINPILPKECSRFPSFSNLKTPENLVPLKS